MVELWRTTTLQRPSDRKKITAEKRLRGQRRSATPSGFNELSSELDRGGRGAGADALRGIEDHPLSGDHGNRQYQRDDQLE